MRGSFFLVVRQAFIRVAYNTNVIETEYKITKKNVKNKKTKLMKKRKSVSLCLI